MIFFLILGVILGVVSVIFVLENVATVTVTFLSWQLTASLALILFGTLLSGAVIALLVLLPSLIKDDLRFAAVKREKKKIEEELERHKTALASRIIEPQEPAPL